jgi:hypothetical protein
MHHPCAPLHASLAPLEADTPALPPGSNSEIRARAHTPGYIRELRRAVSFTSDPDADSEEDVSPSRQASSHATGPQAHARAANPDAAPDPVRAGPGAGRAKAGAFRSKSAAPVLESYPPVLPDSDDTASQLARKVQRLVMRGVPPCCFEFTRRERFAFREGRPL